MSAPRQPSGLKASGSRLWDAIVGDLPSDMEFDQRELAILRAACRQADMVAALESAVGRDGVMVVGAAGQRRLNAAVTELRQGRIALARLLGDLAIPADAGRPQTAGSKRAAHAAEARWAAHRARREVLGA